MLQCLVVNTCFLQAVYFRSQFIGGAAVGTELLVNVLVERLVFCLCGGVFRYFANLLAQAHFFLLQRFELVSHLQCVLGGLLFSSFFFSGDALLFRQCCRCLELVFPVGLGGLGFGTAALDVPACWGKSAAQHGSADEAVDVLFACIFVCDVQPGLQALQHLLRGFRYTFPACGSARFKGVVHDGFAKRLVCNCPSLLGCQLGAYGAEQLADTGYQGHGGSVDQCLWDSSAKSSSSAGFFQRLACLQLSAKVGACELTRGHSACAKQAQASSNRGGYWGGQSSKTCGCRSNHVRH